MLAAAVLRRDGTAVQTNTRWVVQWHAHLVHRWSRKDIEALADYYLKEMQRPGATKKNTM